MRIRRLFIVLFVFLAVAVFASAGTSRKVEDLREGERITQRQNEVNLITEHTMFKMEARNIFGIGINGYQVERINSPHNEFRYGFTFQEKNPQFVRFMITSNRTLEKKGDLILEAVEETITTSDKTEVKKIVYNFNDLQQKNPNGEVSIGMIGGNYFLDARNITDWDPTITYQFITKAVGTYNNTEYASQQDGIRLKKDLILYVPFENSNRSDMSFNNLVSTFGSTTNTTHGYLGTDGESFYGAQQIKFSAETEKLDFNGTSNLTFSLYIDAAPWAGSREVLVSRRSAKGWLLQITSNRFSFFTDHGAPVSDCTSISNVADGLPHYLTAVHHSNKTKEVWVDGVHEKSCDTAAFDDFMQYGLATNIGSAGGANYYKGLIDDVRIYKRALNKSEIIELNSSIPQHKVVSEGNFTSPSIMSNETTTKWNNITVHCELYDNWHNVTSNCFTNLSLSYRLSTDNTTWGSWLQTNRINKDYIIDYTGEEEFLQYRLHLNTTNTSLTPLVRAVNVTYEDGIPNIFNFGVFRTGLEHITFNFTKINESLLSESVCTT